MKAKSRIALLLVSLVLSALALAPASAADGCTWSQWQGVNGWIGSYDCGSCTETWVCTGSPCSGWTFAGGDCGRSPREA
jgi:hypothetical protein